MDLIDREAVEKITWEEPTFTDALNVLSEVRDKVRELPPVQAVPIEVLDKIRAEIEALNPVDYVSMSSYEGHRGASDMKDDVLQIIDKYRAERSDKE